MRTECDVSAEVPVTAVLHQLLAIYLYFFYVVVLDMRCQTVRKDYLWWLSFVWR